MILYIKTSKQRHKFLKENPGIKLPPPFYVYETFNLNYPAFYDKSNETAKWLVSYFRKYYTLENISILDWGCGPGRIIRHLPVLLDSSCSFYGTDYNKKYITWCSKNIPGVTFYVNNLQPPLQFMDNMFDIIYGISIFTHLSLQMHYAWFNELIRILKPGGILFLTLQGEAFRIKLSANEKNLFDAGELIMKANTKEGHRTFSAFQPPVFVKKLIGKNELLEHVAGEIKNGKPEQDVWIIRKSRDTDYSCKTDTTNIS